MKINRNIVIFSAALLILCLSVFSAKTLYSQDSLIVSGSGLSKDYFKSYLTDSRDIIISPAVWNKKQWVIFGTVTGVTVGLFSLDKNINKWFQANRTDFSDKVSTNFIEPFGGGALYKNYTILTLASIYLYSTISKSYPHKTLALDAAKAFAISGLFVYITKAGFGRHRPFQDNPSDPFNWEGPNIDNYYSFVSGHTMTTFAVATVIADEYRDRPIIPIVAYSLAGLVGISRIHDNKHWASDVFGGAAFGWAIGKLISNKRHNRINFSGNRLTYCYSF